MTPEAVEAVRAVYPQTFAAMQGKLVEALSAGDRPAYAARQQISKILGQDVDTSASVLSLAMSQAAYGSSKKAGSLGGKISKPRMSRVGAGKITLGSRTATPFEGGEEIA